MEKKSVWPDVIVIVVVVAVLGMFVVYPAIQKINSERVRHEDIKGIQPIKVPVTMYSSEIGQTDATPYITASGRRVCDGIVACNLLPFGTRLVIEGFDVVFVVQDRLAPKYSDRIDIWTSNTQVAKLWGKQTLRVWILDRYSTFDETEPERPVR